MTVTFNYAKQPNAKSVALQANHQGQCHCGAIVFNVNFAEPTNQPCRCNCSLCRRRGSVMGFVEQSEFTLLKGHQKLKEYQFNTGVARHFFCSICGVYTHHQRRSVPSQFAVNLGCLEGIDPLSLAEVPIIDGAGRHPSDD